MTGTTVTGWLLDTHALLWMLHGDKRLSKKAAAAIDDKLPVYHSSASFWETRSSLLARASISKWTTTGTKSIPTN